MNMQSNSDICVTGVPEKTHCGCNQCGKKSFCWSAVVAGALVGVGISFLLNIFGTAIGLTAFATTTSAPTLAIGGLIGLLIGAIVSMGALGWVAGYLGGLKSVCCKKDNLSTGCCNHGGIYGFVAWVLALMLTILLSTQAAKFVSYSMAALTHPTVAIEKYNYSANTTTAAPQLTEGAMATENQVTTIDEQAAAKNLAITSFIVFILFFVGAISACLFAHIAFGACLRKHIDQV